jgi:hypothetical protein
MLMSITCRNGIIRYLPRFSRMRLSRGAELLDSEVVETERRQGLSDRVDLEHLRLA